MRATGLVCAILASTGLSYAVGFVSGTSSVDSLADRPDDNVFGSNEAAGVGSQSPQSLHELPEDRLVVLLSAATDLQRNAAVREWLQRRDRYTAALSAIAGDREGPPGTRRLAAKLLGGLGCDLSIPTLVDNLDWEERVHAIDETSDLTAYPCAQALGELGVAAVPFIVQGLARVNPTDVTETMIERRVSLL